MIHVFCDDQFVGRIVIQSMVELDDIRIKDLTCPYKDRNMMDPVKVTVGRTDPPVMTVQITGPVPGDGLQGIRGQERVIRLVIRDLGIIHNNIDPGREQNEFIGHPDAFLPETFGQSE